jgi:hypothetical protein
MVPDQALGEEVPGEVEAALEALAPEATEGARVRAREGVVVVAVQGAPINT